MSDTLEHQIDHWFAQGSAAIASPDAERAFHQLRDGLETGQYRAAEPDPTLPIVSGAPAWRVNSWVKRGILLGFRLGRLESASAGDVLSCVDKHTFPVRRFTPEQNIRIVTGGTSVRAGAFLAPGVIVVPPAYINTGAHVGEATMVDSHALVGSCAQIGARVHLSAAAQIGGVLEPVNASPVIVEDDCLIGGNTGVYEGTIVRRRAVLAAGVVLTRGTPVFDLVTGQIHRATPTVPGPDGSDTPGTPLIIPENAVVVPGSRAITHGRGKDWGLSLATPVIVKYRDDKTELSLALEDLLR